MGMQCDDGNSADWDGCTDGQLSEFQVNSYSVSDQVGADVVMLPDDDFVIVWQSSGQDGSGDGIFARSFASSGVENGVDVNPIEQV